MAARRAACRLPEGVPHRSKWQLGLDLLDELAGWELRPPVLLADSGEGRWASSVLGWTIASSPRWSRSGPTPAPTPAGGSDRRPPRAAVPAPATATRPARCTSSRCKLGSRPAES
jgi:DDE superfamily endonuclease